MDGASAPSFSVPASVPVLVKAADGRWHEGFELLRFDDDGLAAVRSIRTGTVCRLPPAKWFDPLGAAALAAIAAQQHEAGR